MGNGLMIRFNDTLVINFGKVRDVELSHEGKGVRITYQTEGNQPIQYRDLTGRDAEAFRNWARTQCTGAYPDRVEHIQTTLTSRPMAQSAGGGTQG
jgi:hypothetical protein